MNIISIKCPNCGGVIEREDGAHFAGCPYCGKTHDGNILDRLLGLIHTFLHVIRTLFKVVPKN